MNQSVIVALISMIGIVIGTLLGIMTSAKLAQFRLKKFEARDSLRGDQKDQLTRKVTIAVREIVEIQQQVKELKCETEKLSYLINTKCTCDDMENTI